MVFDMDTRSEELIASAEEVDADPTQLEINTAIAKLKNNKAPRSDSIPAELLKFGRAELNKRIYQIISQIWSREELPNE
jgi:hypothetical protein